LSPADRRAYWFGRQIGYFRRRMRGTSELVWYEEAAKLTDEQWSAVGLSR
jgi:hypothetical protein